MITGFGSLICLTGAAVGMCVGKEGVGGGLLIPGSELAQPGMPKENSFERLTV